MNKAVIVIVSLMMGSLVGYLFAYYVPLNKQISNSSSNVITNEFWSCYNLENGTLQCNHYIPQKTIHCNLSKLYNESKNLWEGC